MLDCRHVMQLLMVTPVVPEGAPAGSSTSLQSCSCLLLLAMPPFPASPCRSARLNELWVLDLDSWCWLVPEAGGTAPSPRQGAALAMHGECSFASDTQRGLLAV